MANLEQIKASYEKPKGKSGLTRGNLDNERTSFHAKIVTDHRYASTYLSRFVQKFSEIIGSPSKADRLKQYLDFPLHTSTTINKATDDLNAFFSAEDRFIDYRFTDREYANEFQAYLDQKSFDRYISNTLFSLCLESPNGVIVIDMQSDRVQGPQPYWYFLPFGKIHHLKVDDVDTILEIGWKIKKGEDTNAAEQYVFIDATGYYVYNVAQNEFTEQVANLHGLGYCPVTFIWHDVQEAGEIARLAPLTPLLTKLDELEYDTLAKRFAEQYAKFPIIWTFDNGDNTKDIAEPPLSGKDPDYEGTMYLDGDNRLVASPFYRPAPKPSELIGPGSKFTITTPPYSEKGVDFKAPVGFVQATRELLDYNKESIEFDEETLKFTLSGVYTPKQGEAFNQDQIKSQYESRKAVLKYWAENFERTHLFMVDTIARLMYGELYISSTVQYGEDFFIIDEGVLLQQYVDSKNAGLPQYLVSSKRRQLEQIEAKRVPARAQRLRLESQLEPFPDLSIDKIPAVGPDYTIKLRFSEYIDRFERENGPLIDFGVDLPENERIFNIKQTLISYATEDSNILKGKQEDDLRGGQGFTR